MFFIIVIEAQIPTEEDLMENGNVRFPPPAGDENAVRFNNMTPTIQIPANIIIQRIEIEGLIIIIKIHTCMHVHVLCVLK